MAGLNFNITANNSDFISKMSEVRSAIDANAKASESASERQAAAQQKVVQAQQQQTVSLTEINSLLQQLNGTHAQHVAALNATNAELDKNKQKQDNLSAAYESGKVSQKAYEDGMKNLASMERELTADKQNILKTLKQEATLQNTASGSYDQAKIQLSMLKAAYKSMSDEEKRSPLGKQTGAAIQTLATSVKQMTVEMKQMDGTATTQNIRTQLRQVVAEIGNIRVALSQMSQEERNGAAGQELAARLKEATQQASQLKAAMNAANKSVKNMASVNRELEGVEDGLQLMLAGYTEVTGAAALLGAEEQDLVEIQTKLQAAYTMSSGLMTIRTKLLASSALMQGIDTIQTKAAAVAENIKTAAVGKGVVATKLATVAQAAFNAVAKANPYVLLATALITVVGALVAFAKGSKKAKEEEAARQEEIRKSREAHDEFTAAVAKDAASQINKYAQLKRAWERLGDSMSKKNDFIKQNKTEFENLGFAVENVDQAERLLVKNSESVIKALVAKAKAAALVGQMENVYAEEIKAVDKAEQDTKDMPTAKKKGDIVSYEEAAKAGFAGVGEHRYTQASTSGYNGGVTYHIEDLKAFNDAWNEANAKKRKELQDKAKKSSEAKIKKLTKQLDDVDGIAEGLIKDIGVPTADGKAEKKSGKASSDKSTESLAEKQQRLEELRAKNAEEDKRQIEDLQNEISQLEIDSLADGWEKEQRQRSLNHSLRLQELRREKEDAVAAVKDRAKAEFDAEENVKKQQNKKYTVKQFDWDTDATDKQKEQLSAVEQNYDRQINTQTAINLKEDADALKESLKDYRGYFEQRDDIIKKYQKQAQQWFETDENGNVKTTDGKGLAADRSNAVLKEGVTQTNVDELNRQQDEELNAIDQQFASRSEYFQAWCDEVTNVSLERLGELIEQAETELAALEQSGSVDPTQMAMIRAQLNLMKQQKQSKQAKQDTDKNAPKKKTIAKWEQYAAAIGQASEVLEQMADMMPGKLNKIFRTISTLGTAISSIITGITTLAKGSVDSMKTTSKEASDAIKAVERASVILAIIGAVLEAVQKITSLFGADYSDYNKMKEEYEAVSEVWDELIDKKKEYLSISYGDELKDTREQYEDLVAKKDAAARQMYVERVNSGASAGSHSIGQRFVNKLDDSPETKAAFVAALNKAGSSWSEALGGGRMDGLANLTADQLQIIKEQAPAAWAALDEDMQNYLEDIIECKDQLQEMEETLQTQIAGLTFDEFRNNFLEALQDMDTSAADFAEDMNEYMTNSLISDMFSKKYEENLKKLYDEYYEAMQIADETEREKEAKKVLEKIQDETSKAKADAKAIQDSTGYTNQQQEGSEGGFESMSQDTAEELSGRFTALQVTAQQTYLLVSAMEQYLSASNAVLTVQNSFLSSINDNVAKSNGFLDDILEVNKKIYTEFGERITAMDEKLRTL